MTFDVMLNKTIKLVPEEKTGLKNRLNKLLDDLNWTAPWGMEIRIKQFTQILIEEMPDGAVEDWQKEIKKLIHNNVPEELRNNESDGEPTE